MPKQVYGWGSYRINMENSRPLPLGSRLNYESDSKTTGLQLPLPLSATRRVRHADPRFTHATADTTCATNLRATEGSPAEARALDRLHLLFLGVRGGEGDEGR